MYIDKHSTIVFQQNSAVTVAFNNIIGGVMYVVLSMSHFKETPQRYFMIILLALMQ